MSTGFQSPSQFGPPQFSPSPFQQPARKSGSSWLAGILMIGLGLFLLGGIACSAGVWYIASNLDKWVVSIGREAIVAGINDSQLPDDQKAEIVTQVDRVVAAYKAGKLKQSDLERVLGQLEDSPAMQTLVLYGMEDEFLSGTSLSDKEVEQGRRAFQRALRAVYEGKITGDDFWNVLPDEDEEEIRLASTRPAESNADDDLRETIAKLKVIADNAGISDEPFQLNIAAEVKKLVDKALEGK
jgi:hypothetical protein